MKIRQVFDLATIAVSLRSACDISRAWRPTCESPISPSSSALGTSAATESTTTTSTLLERTSISVISRACSPLSGWETRRLSMSTPSFLAYSASSACSASMNAAVPPFRCAWPTTESASVVLPDDSGPKTSTTRPRGKPPIPIAQSTASEPVGIASITNPSREPRRMIAPLPNWRSIWESAPSIAFKRSAALTSGFASDMGDLCSSFSVGRRPGPTRDRGAQVGGRRKPILKDVKRRGNLDNCENFCRITASAGAIFSPPSTSVSPGANFLRTPPLDSVTLHP